MTRRVLVTGAAGFLGRRLVSRLEAAGCQVRGADVEAPDSEDGPADEFLRLDLREAGACAEAVAGVEEVYHLAADTGGIGPATATHASVCHNNTTMNLRMLEAAAAAGVTRFLFTSSSRVYPGPPGQPAEPDPVPEEQAWPADPEPGHGEEKLYAERLCAHYRADVGLDTRVVRLGALYGPGGRIGAAGEASPTGLCHGVAVTPPGGSLTLWGSGREVHTWLHVDDAAEGLLRVIRSDCPGPVNLGGTRPVTTNELAEAAIEVSGRDVSLEHDLGKPGGGGGRVLDLTRLRRTAGWRPEVDLEAGLAETYGWVEARVRGTAAAHRHPGPPHLP